MAAQEPCTCASCAPVNTEVICQTMAQSAMRFNEGSNQSASMSISNGIHLQHQYNTQAQQALESTNNSRLISDVLLALAAGRNIPNTPVS